MAWNIRVCIVADVAATGAIITYSDGGQSVKQRRKTRLNDGRLVNIVWVNDGRLPLHC